MFSAAPAMLRTASGLTSIVEGDTGTGFRPAVTTTSSLNWDWLSSRTSTVTGWSATVTSTCSVRCPSAVTTRRAVPLGSVSAKRPSRSVTAFTVPAVTRAPASGPIENASTTRPVTLGAG